MLYAYVLYYKCYVVPGTWLLEISKVFFTLLETTALRYSWQSHRDSGSMAPLCHRDDLDFKWSNAGSWTVLKTDGSSVVAGWLTYWAVNPAANVRLLVVAGWGTFGVLPREGLFLFFRFMTCADTPVHVSHWCAQHTVRSFHKRSCIFLWSEKAKQPVKTRVNVLPR